MTSKSVPLEVPRPVRSLPVIETAFARRLHPHWPTVQERTRNWLLDMNLMPADKVERYADGLRYTDLMAGYYLGAPDDVLQAIADYSAWFFVWDDRHDRDTVHARAGAWRRLRRQLHAAVDSPSEHMRDHDPLVTGFADSVQRLYSYLGKRWNARFARHFHAVIEAYDREFRNRTRGVVPAVRTYLELRRLTFAHAIWIDLLELSAGCELPAYVRDHRTYRRATVLSQDFAAWYNDLCSLPKELAGGETHNLGICLIHHEGMNREEAIAEVRRRVTESIAEFVVVERKALRFAESLADGTPRGEELSVALTACLANTRNWFSSVYWFHHESGRYMVDSWEDPSTPAYISDRECEK